MKLAIQKELFKSDMSKDLDRLTIPVIQAMIEFLNVEEEAVLENKKAVAVRVIEPYHYLGETIALNLRRWELTSPTSYVITTFQTSSRFGRFESTEASVLRWLILDKSRLKKADSVLRELHGVHGSQTFF